MSELKAIRSGEIYNIIEYEDCYRTDDLYYPKSEADKVIAEKDKEIARLDDLAHAHNIELLRKENLIAELKEERRWRNCSEEKPQDGQEVWAYDTSQKLVIKLEYQVREDCEGFVGFPLIHGFWPYITYWMPYNTPKSPEEER